MCVCVYFLKVNKEQEGNATHLKRVSNASPMTQLYIFLSNQVDLFFRLGYVGVWDKYKWDAYAEIAGEKNKTLSIDTGQFFTAGYIQKQDR